MKVVLVFLFINLTSYAKAASVANEEVSGQIKSCLVDLYIAQQRFFETNAVYTSSVNDLKIGDKSACKGIQISCELANNETFILVGKSKGEHWTLDESKSLTQVQ